MVELAPSICVTLAHAYLSKKGDVCTISPCALKRHAGCKQATLSPRVCKNHNQEKSTNQLRTSNAAGLYYIKLKVHYVCQEKSNHQSTVKLHLQLAERKFKPISQGRFQPSDGSSNYQHPNKNYDHAQHSLREVNAYLNMELSNAVASEDKSQLACDLHIKFGHQNMDYIRRSAKQGIIKGLPNKIPNLKYDCPLCKIASAPKITRGKLVDCTELWRRRPHSCRLCHLQRFIVQKIQASAFDQRSSLDISNKKQKPSYPANDILCQPPTTTRVSAQQTSSRRGWITGSLFKFYESVCRRTEHVSPNHRRLQLGKQWHSIVSNQAHQKNDSHIFDESGHTRYPLVLCIHIRSLHAQSPLQSNDRHMPIVKLEKYHRISGRIYHQQSMKKE